MAGFWEALVATHLYNTTTHVLQTVNQFLTSVSAGTIVIFQDSLQQNIFTENHLLNTSGPTSAGWNVSGGGRKRTVEMFSASNYPQVPLGSSAVIVKLSAHLTTDASQAVGAVNLLQLNARNNDITLDNIPQGFIQNVWKASGSAGQAIADNEDLVLIPGVSGSKTNVDFFASWPNIAASIPGVFVQADLMGYIK
jgi:hypothetical protein